MPCKVCDREEPQYAKVKWWDTANYCSYYCQRFDELGLKKEKLSASKHHNNLWMYPPIPTPCETCGTEFDLRWNDREHNRAFCSQTCNNTRLKGKKRTKKHYFPMKILKHAPEPMAAVDLLPRLDGHLATRYTSTAVSQIFRIYVAKGFLEYTEVGTPYPHRQYIMTDWAKSQPVKTLLI